jgi:quercetin dioxygenase-like cupin family protein
MPLSVRRVITGHDDAGKAIVVDDSASPNMAGRRPGTEATVVWVTEGFPVNNDGYSDVSQAQETTTHPNGTVFRIVSFAPGNTPRMHRTDSIDYALILSGEIDMELDDSTMHLKAGDVVVQRGTNHNWMNRGTEPCIIAFVLIDAKSVEVGGKVLEAHG